MSSSWNPTHVVVAVQRAKDLKSKGKNGTNDAFVTIALASNKFQTSIKDKVIDPEWYEECDVPLPENYTDHHVILQVCHRNNLGIDEFLGHLEIPLQNFDVYDPPRAVWYSLVCKPGQNKNEPRGEMEIRLAFEVKKVKDMDSMSITSSASKRFKMRRKIKGPKAEKTADYIPDLTGLDSGNLDMDDIAENYASVTPSRRKLSNSDSLSLPPASPAFARGSPRSSKGYSPFNKRSSRADPDTPTSSNASTEDIRQRAEDADSNDGSFLRTHKRGGSGSDIHVKPNRRLLTASRPKSSSTVDISSTSASEVADASRGFALMDEGFGKSRLRAATSASQISNEILPEVEENNKDEENEVVSNRRPSLVSSVKVVDEPVLIDDDESDDSMSGYRPSPIIALVKTEEPADIFARITAQSELEKADAFNLIKHQAEPGEEIFTPVRKVAKPDIEVSAAHSTPIVEEPKTVTSSAKPKSKSKGNKKKSADPAQGPNMFDLLMASDEPEYNVDSTMDKPVDDKSGVQTIAVDKQSGTREKILHEPKISNPFGGEDEDANAFSESTSSPAESNPFEEKFKPVESNPFEEPTKPPAESNPFGEPTPPPVESNPFGEPTPPPVESNPFDKRAEPTLKHDTPNSGSTKSSTHTNPFEELTPSPADANPFEEITKPSQKPNNPFNEPASVTNSFEEPAASNPFEEVDMGSNPFEDDEDEESPSFNRAGSSRFGKSSRSKSKKKEKAAAPPPPKPQRLFPEKQDDSPTPTPKHSSHEVGVTSKPPLPVSNSPSKLSSPSDSPRGKSKKDKKAPRAPSPSVGGGLMQDHSRTRSSSHNTSRATEGKEDLTRRRESDTGRMEQVAYHIDQPGFLASKAGFGMGLTDSGKSERQPAVGAEAPDLPTEPRSTREVGVQVRMAAATNETGDVVGSEFRNHSKQELVEIIQKLRQQMIKKDEHAKDLKEYIDSLLLRVMSADPNLLIAQPSCSQQANKLR